MNFNMNYYFEDIQNNEVFNKLINNKNEVLEIFKESSKIIDNIESNGKQEIYTDNIQENVKIKGNVYIGEGTKIESGAIIQGPVYIGKNCEIMYNAYIRPGTILGDNCTIGYCTEVKHTIMRDGSKVSDLAFVGDSIIGKNSRVGSGVIVANRGFNQSEVIIKDEEKRPINLKREAIGVILGDNARIGSNSTTSPGTFIRKIYMDISTYVYSWIYTRT